MRLGAIIAAVVLVTAVAAEAQYGPTAADAAGGPAAAAPVVPGLPTVLMGDPGASGGIDPVSVLAAAAAAIPGETGAGAPQRPGLSAAMSIMLVLTVITLVPSIILMTTCFVRIIVVLGLLRQAIGAPSLPPPQVVLALSLFMTLLVMAPTVDRIHDEAIVPWREGRLTDTAELWDAAKQPLRDFMFAQIEATGNWSSVTMVLAYRGVDTSQPEKLTRGDVDMVSLIPAFMLSELKTAFLMGFRVYLPFLVIDMVISTMLISMSMMMLPPVLISLPFKLLLFVLVDGWALVVGSLMHSFAQPGGAVALLPGAVGLPELFLV